ncbi:MAG: signal recognition particle-docking protein FtsY [Candidatus Ozemobacteraceae bacterium]
MSDDAKTALNAAPQLPTQPVVPVSTADTWDEPRIVVFLIGLCLMLEAGLIYYQNGASQSIVSAITGISGFTLLLFSWLVPLEDEESDEQRARPEETIERTVTGLPTASLPPAAVGLHPPSTTIPPAVTTVTPFVVTPLDAEAEARRQAAAEAALISEDAARKTAEAEAEREIASARQEDGVAVFETPPLSWFDRLRKGLTKTRSSFVGRLKKLVFGSTKIDAELLEELEATLFEADIGVKTSQELLDTLHQRVEKEDLKEPNAMYAILKDELKKRLTRLSPDPNMNADGMTVFLIIGVNGVGKTTTIAKLARKYVKDGKKVVLAAGDTFRAAAIEQLTIWGQRAGADVIKGAEGGDPGALVFDAIHAARKRQADLLVIDTAGRMHVKVNLMDELKKIRKIVEKETVTGPHEILLVLDATTGQNAIQQAKLFNEAIPISGLILTKLDGTAKGGVIFAVEEQLNVPVKFIGIGEKLDDLMPFHPDEFLEALFSDDTEKTKKSDYNVL